MEFARHLDRAFHRLGAGIGEEHQVREGRLAQARRQPFGLRDAIEVGDVPERARLLGHGGDEMRMRVPERIHGDARGEIEIALAVGRDQPAALAALESEVDPGIGRQQMRGRLPGHGHGDDQRKRNVPPLRAALTSYFIARLLAVNTAKPGLVQCRIRASGGQAGNDRPCPAREKCGRLTIRHGRCGRRTANFCAGTLVHTVGFRSSDTTFRWADEFQGSSVAGVLRRAGMRPPRPG